MSAVPTSEPVTLRAGDSVAWTKSLPDYPASAGWALTYRFLHADAAAVEISASASGDAYAASLSAAASAALEPGTWTLIGLVAKGAERVTVYQRAVQVLPNLGRIGSLDGRSAARRALDAYRAAWYAWAESGETGTIRVRVLDREVEFADAADFIAKLNALELEVYRERANDAAINHGVAAGRIQYRG